MEEVIAFLIKSGTQYFATAGLDGKPKVRPFQFMIEKDGKPYFCTANTKAVYREMQKNPWVELCAAGESFSWLRLSGRVRFTDDLTVKAEILDASPLIQSIYHTAGNPELTVFYLSEINAVIRDFSGSPPKVFTS